MFEAFLLGLGGLLLSVLSFLVGKLFSQSEKILDHKREAYSSFLKLCPVPNEAHFADKQIDFAMMREIGVLSLYASPEATKLAAEYFDGFANAQEELVDVAEPGHPEYLKVMTKYNRMVWAMRNDVMTWSIFAPKKSAVEYKPSVFTGDGDSD